MRSIFKRKPAEVSKPAITAPIIVYQMGKVGSMSIYYTLTNLELGVPVYHSHALNELDELEAAMRHSLVNPDDQDPTGTLAGIRESKRIRDEYLEWKGDRWNIISAVRDPVPRNISAFFHAVTERIPNFYEKARNGELSVDYLTELFLEDFISHNTPVVWFTDQMRKFFHINVYTTPFPRERGYAIYEGRWARLLVLRLEDFNKCLGPAMEEFLGLGDFPSSYANVGESKEYAPVYQRFLKEVKLPKEYLDDAYGSFYAKYFYSEDELARFRSRWER